MEKKGFRCIENCPHESSVKIVKKPIDPELLSKWNREILIEKTKLWACHAKTHDGLILYYNPDSISKDRYYVTYRSQVNFTNETIDTNFGYVWRSVKVNCADKIFKLSNFIAVDKDGDATDPGVIETKWADLPDDSLVGKFAYKICRGEL
jgi:hypothetical protein